MDIRTALKLTKGDVFAAAILAEGWRGRYDERAQELFDMKEDDLPKKAKVFIGKKQDSYQQQAPDAQKLEWFKEYAEMEANSPQKGARPQKRARLEEDTLPDDAKQILELNRLLTAYVSENPGDYYFSLKKGVDWVNSDAGWVQLNDREGRTGLEVQHGDVVVVFKPEDSSAASGSSADEDMREPSVVTFDDDDARNVAAVEYYDEDGVAKEEAEFSVDKEESEDESLLDESLDPENLVDMHFLEQERLETVPELEKLDAEMISNVLEADESDFFLTEEFEQKVDEAEQWIAGELENLWFYAMDKYQDKWNEGEAPDSVFDFVQELDYEGYFKKWYPGWDGNVDKILLNRAMDQFWGFDNLEREAAVERFFGITEEEDFNPQHYQFARDYEAIRDSKNTNHPVVENLIKQLEEALAALDVTKVSGNTKYPSKAWFQNWNLFKKFRDQTGKRPGEKRDKVLTDRTRVRVAQAVLHHWGTEDFNQYEVALQDIPKNSFLEQFKTPDEIREELRRLELNWTLQQEPQLFKYVAALYRNLYFKTEEMKLPVFASPDQKQRDLKNFELFRYCFTDLEKNLVGDRTLDESEEDELEELQELFESKENEIFERILDQTEEGVFDTKAALRERKRLMGERRKIQKRIELLQTVSPLERMRQLRVFRDHSANEHLVVQKAWQFYYYRKFDPESTLDEAPRIKEELDEIFGRQSAVDVLRLATEEERLDAEENAKSWKAKEKEEYKEEDLEEYKEELKYLYGAWERERDLIPPKVHEVLRELLKRAHDDIKFVYHSGSVYKNPPEDYSDFFPEKLSFAYWEEKVKKDFEKWIDAKIEERQKTHDDERDLYFTDQSYENVGPGKVRRFDSPGFEELIPDQHNNSLSRALEGRQDYYDDRKKDVYYVKENVVDVRKRRIRQWAVRFVFGYVTLPKKEISDRNPGEILNKTAERLNQMKGYTKGWWSKNSVGGIYRYLPITMVKFTEWMDGIIEEMVNKLHSKLK